MSPYVDPNPQPKAPFKFLDSYNEGDFDEFFGREEETNKLYDTLSGVKHLLVYGPSGAGKTSLIECGLRNQFSDADWFALTIRKGENITASVYNTINEQLVNRFKIASQSKLPIDEKTNQKISFGNAIRRLYGERFQPIYLLFDQFEELFISGNDEEKKDFFTRLHKLIRYKVPCRVLLIMREEFIGHLSEFEPLCPSIFQHRFRLEKMRRSAVQCVIFNILNAPRYQNYFHVKNPELLAENILKKLPDQKQEIELAHVQVFLSELWDRADEKKEENEKPLLHQGLIKENDNLTTVLNSFLKKQLKELEYEHEDNALLGLLAAMISEKHTKLQLSENDLKEKLEEDSVLLKKPLIKLLEEFISRGIIRQLKSDNETQYEISHDVLATVVGESLPEEYKLKKKAAEIFKMYIERTSYYYSKDDLDHLRLYKQYAKYPKELKHRIIESEMYLTKKRQVESMRLKRRQWTLRILFTCLFALVIVGYFAYKSHQQHVELDKALSKSEKLTNAFYFYSDKYALALKKEQYYFIDKNGDEVTKFHKWEYAEQFHWTGFARVKKKEGGRLREYLLDTLGNTFQVAFDIKDLNKNITALDLSHKKLKLIPESVFQHTQLKVLILNDNELKKLPSEIGKLENITTLILNNNELDSLPTAIGKLKKIIMLNLRFNKLSSLPKNFGNLKSMTELRLSYNDMKHIPLEVMKLKNLTKLELDDNELRNIPSRIEKLEKLNILNLSGNKLENLPNQFWNLKKLKIFDISFNQLNDLPNQIFEMKDLQTLNLNNNNLTVFPTQIRNLKNLRKLNLSGNKLGDLSDKISSMKKLNILYDNYGDGDVPPIK